MTEFKSEDYLPIYENHVPEQELRRYRYFERKGFRGHEIIPGLGNQVLMTHIRYNPLGELSAEAEPHYVPDYNGLFLTANLLIAVHEIDTSTIVSEFDRFGIVKYASEKYLALFDHAPNDKTFSLPPGMLF